MSDAPIYLDGHATTPVDPRVLDAMLPYFTVAFGNAASTQHAAGRRAANAVEEARAAIAACITAAPKSIVFTSGATESNNLALFGACAAASGRDTARRRIVSAVTEHKAVLDPLDRLERDGWEVHRLAVGESGIVDPAQVADALDDRTLLVTLMHANNETGVVQDIAAIGAACAERGVLFHTDATQSVGKIAAPLGDWPVDLASFSAHKVYGPKGVGALYIRPGRPRVRLRPLVEGGGHERGLRSGTLNVPAIVGFGAALRISSEEREADAARLGALRDRMRRRLFSALDHVHENGDPSRKLPHSLSIAFDYVESVALLNELPGLALSTGSACSSADPEPSHVLRAIAGEGRARSSVRIGLTRFTAEAEADRAVDLLVEAVRKLRSFSPLYAMDGGGGD